MRGSGEWARTRTHPALGPGGVKENYGHKGRQGRPSSLTCSSTLEASSLQHLLVLLLSHALAALLNKRSHGGATVAARGSLVRNELLAAADRGDRDRWKRKSSGAGTRTPNDWTKTSRVANYTTPER